MQYSKSLGCAAVLAVLGCSDTNTTTVIDSGTGSGNAGQGAGGTESNTGSGSSNSGGTDSPPLYVLSMVVFGDEGTSTYVLPTNTLEMASVSLDDAREFPGYHSLGAVNGHLFVAQEEQVLTKFRITDALEFEQAGTVSFANYGVDVGGEFWQQYVVGNSLAYVGLEATKNVLWNPSTMEVLGVRETSNVPLQDSNGRELLAGFSRSDEVRAGPVMRPFLYHQGDYVNYSNNTLIAVYDSDTHEERAVVDVPCTALQVQTFDEEGNTYWSVHQGEGSNPVKALYNEQNPPCVARFDKDGNYDKSFTSALTDMTDGRFVATFRYMRDGKALGAVFYPERSNLDLDAEFDDSFLDEIYNPQAWRLWLFDLNNREAKPVEGIESFAAGFQYLNTPERTVVMVTEDESESTTLVYEISPEGEATSLFQTEGWLYQLFELR